MTPLTCRTCNLKSFFPVVLCSKEYVANIVKIWKISRYMKKVNIFSMTRYDTINRYQKQYIDIFDIPSDHYLVLLSFLKLLYYFC